MGVMLSSIQEGTAMHRRLIVKEHATNIGFRGAVKKQTAITLKSKHNYLSNLPIIQQQACNNRRASKEDNKVGS